MALGYCPALLNHLNVIAGQNYNGSKVTVPGFLNMLLTQPNRPTVLQDAYRGGHRRGQTVKYKARTTESQVSTTDTCALDLVPLYKETSVSVDNIAQIGIWMSDDTIRQYCEDASRMVTLGTPPTPLMEEHLDSILHALNGLYQKMENVLTTDMASLFGKHVGTGSATAVSVNIEQDATLNDLTTGLTKMLTDAQSNEFCGTPIFVGALGSLMHSFAIQAGARALQTAGTAFDAQRLADAMPFQFFASGKTGSTWGAQHVGMFAPESVHLLERLDNKGSFAGQNLMDHISRHLLTHVYSVGHLMESEIWNLTFKSNISHVLKKLQVESVQATSMNLTQQDVGICSSSRSVTICSLSLLIPTMEQTVCRVVTTHCAT